MIVIVMIAIMICLESLFMFVILFLMDASIGVCPDSSAVGVPASLVLVVAMFMFVCGGSFLVKAQSSAEAVTAPTEINATVVNDTVVKDTVTKEDAPAKASLVALAANVNDTVVTDTTSKDKPAEPVKE